MALEYLAKTWQGFLQQVVYLAGRGYQWHCRVELPEKKREKWGGIDRKLIAKYGCDKSKFQRARMDAKAGTTQPGTAGEGRSAPEHPAQDRRGMGS